MNHPNPNAAQGKGGTMLMPSSQPQQDGPAYGAAPSAAQFGAPMAAPPQAQAHGQSPMPHQQVPGHAPPAMAPHAHQPAHAHQPHAHLAAPHDAPGPQGAAAAQQAFGQYPSAGVPAPSAQGHQAPAVGPQHGAMANPPAKEEDELSVDAVIGAIMGGEGFHSPRKLGAMMVGAGVLIFIANIVIVFVLRIYFPYLWLLVPPAWFCGGFMVVTGQPKAQPGGAPMWARAAMGICAVAGLIAGVGKIFLLH